VGCRPLGAPQNDAGKARNASLLLDFVDKATQDARVLLLHGPKKAIAEAHTS